MLDAWDSLIKTSWTIPFDKEPWYGTTSPHSENCYPLWHYFHAFEWDILRFSNVTKNHLSLGISHFIWELFSFFQKSAASFSSKCAFNVVCNSKFKREKDIIHCRQDCACNDGSPRYIIFWKRKMAIKSVFITIF